MKIIIEEHEDTVSISFIGKGKKIDRLRLLTLAAAEKIVHVLFELVRVAARAGSFFLPGHKPISLVRKAASLSVKLCLGSLASFL